MVEKVMTNQELHIQAVTLAKTYLSTEGQLLLVLIEMRRRRAFNEYADSNIFEYCLNQLGLSRSQAYYFKSVAEKSEEVPALTQAVVQGELSLSQARRIASVVTRENLGDWIEKSHTLTQETLEKAVSEINPKSQIREKIKPVARQLSEMRVGIDDATERRLKHLQDVLSQKRGKAATLADTIAWLAEDAEKRHSPEQKAQRVSFRKPMKPASPGRHAIPAKVKHAVIRRQGFQCAYRNKTSRCSQRRFLDFHHLTPVSGGGLNLATNLVLLCKEHHHGRHL